MRQRRGGRGGRRSVEDEEGKELRQQRFDSIAAIARKNQSDTQIGVAGTQGTGDSINI